MIVCRGLGTTKALLVTAGLGLALAVPPAPPVEQYSGGWWERDRRPTAEQVQAERERLGILPPRPSTKSPQAPAPAPTELLRRLPHAQAESSAVAWAAERLAEEVRFADLTTAGRLLAALQAAEDRQAALLAEEADVVHALIELLAGAGQPVVLRAVAAPLAGGEEGDIVFAIAALASIA